MKCLVKKNRSTGTLYRTVTSGHMRLLQNNGQVVITNFDDIYFAMGDDRKPAFYMKNISEW